MLSYPPATTICAPIFGLPCCECPFNISPDYAYHEFLFFCRHVILHFVPQIIHPTICNLCCLLCSMMSPFEETYPYHRQSSTVCCVLVETKLTKLHQQQFPVAPEFLGENTRYNPCFFHQCRKTNIILFDRRFTHLR